MTRVLILGAHGQIARVATRLFLDRPDVRLTLYLRNARRLSGLAGVDRVRVVEGDVLDERTLGDAMAGHDVVYANLSGKMEDQARAIVQAMTKAGVRRLIFVSSMGIHDEIPRESWSSALGPYRKSAEVVEGSGLDYTVVRPAWLSDEDEVHYGTTRKGEPFRNPGGVVSRKSVADVIVKLATTPGLGVGESLGVHKGA
ncbi:NAD(P)H-binding protein [Gemmata sp. JC717]|uniref:NAD(P)H-binding protein n=1 Tax=Gemmata algarum TaxID=2975278 RepID=UPI0021BB999D|nr:NAD(P)H-binding protein [Gemmata algarum]MDY3551151.1 NAD(P)H-binding protein [Gemmata algarum]